jgi:CheY-like chemotaxis protein
VLHVDDDPVVRDLTVELLQQAGFVVASVSNPDSVPARVDAGGVDAVVSDYEMPEMDGDALFEQVRQIAPTLPFVMFTGRDRDAMPTAFESAGRTWFVRKRGQRGFERLADAVGEAVEVSVAGPTVAGAER